MRWHLERTAIQGIGVSFMYLLMLNIGGYTYGPTALTSSVEHALNTQRVRFNSTTLEVSETTLLVAIVIRTLEKSSATSLTRRTFESFVRHLPFAKIHGGDHQNKPVVERYSVDRCLDVLLRIPYPAVLHGYRVRYCEVLTCGYYRP